MARRYQEFYGGQRVYPPEPYRQEIAWRVDKLRKKYGLEKRLPGTESKGQPMAQQLTMAWAPAPA